MNCTAENEMASMMMSWYSNVKNMNRPVTLINTSLFTEAKVP